MNHPPTLDTPLIPGVRKLFSVSGIVTSIGTRFLSSPLIPARSIIRNLFYTADVELENARFVTLRIAFNDTLSPTASDFVGTGLILPDLSQAAAAPAYNAQPELNSAPITLNWQLPNRQSRLIFLLENFTLVTISFVLRLLIDATIRVGADDGSR